MRIHHDHLKARGWTAEEIKRAERVVRKAEKRKRPALRLLERLVFWLLLALTVLAVFAVSLEVAPALLVLGSGVVAFVLVLLGLSFGTLYAFLLHDIEWLETRHHVLGGALLGLVAVLSVWFLTATMNALGMQEHSPLLLGLLFAAALLAPLGAHVWLVNA